MLANISDDEVAEYIQATHLSQLASRSLSSLSGGQRQRVWLASALAQDPEYLLLDEPTTYLDMHYQAKLMTILKQLNQQKHITIIMVLHDINQAFKISDELWLVKAGRLIETGQPEKCYNRDLLASILIPTSKSWMFRVMGNISLKFQIKFLKLSGELSN